MLNPQPGKCLRLAGVQGGVQFSCYILEMEVPLRFFDAVNARIKLKRLYPPIRE